MKTINQQTLLPFLLFLLPLATFAQPRSSNCGIPTAQTDLDINGVRARITNGGDLWWDGNDGMYQVTADDDSPGTNSPNAIFTGGLWLGAMDAGGGLKIAAQRYGRIQGRFDFYPGPLTEQGITESECSEWDRLFPIYRREIQQFLDDFNSGPAIEVANIPDNILGWPATGNPYFEGIHGFALGSTTKELAPFWDEDRDGVYDPLTGDYPLFCGDQAIWCVFNDAGNIHRSSWTPSQLQAEIHLLAYAFASEDSVLHRTTFYDYKIINRGQEDILQLKAGHWIDTNLGCHFNDRVNSAPNRNLFYVYNKDLSDFEVCGILDTTYGTSVPVNIYQVVRSNAAPAQSPNNRLMSSFLNFYGNTIHPPHFGSLLPYSAEGYYNTMNGLWEDGTPVTRGDDGYDAGGDTTRYSYDGGTAADGSTWWHCNTTTFNDFSQLYSTGPYNLQPGDAAEFTLAITTIFGVPYPDSICPDTAAIYAAAEHIKEVYIDNCTASVLSDVTALGASASIGLEVFPNPTSGVVTFRLPANARVAGVEVVDLTGRQLAVVPGEGNEVAFDLKASGLAAGVYVYRLRTEGGKLVAGRVMLME